MDGPGGGISDGLGPCRQSLLLLSTSGTCLCRRGGFPDPNAFVDGLLQHGNPGAQARIRGFDVQAEQVAIRKPQDLLGSRPCR